MRGFVQTGCNTIVIAANRHSVQSAQNIDSFDRIRSITDKIPAAEHALVAGLFCTLDTGFESFYIGMDVAEDEITHGV